VLWPAIEAALNWIDGAGGSMRADFRQKLRILPGLIGKSLFGRTLVFNVSISVPIVREVQNAVCFFCSSEQFCSDAPM
jgi:hypothetical protein